MLSDQIQKSWETMGWLYPPSVAELVTDIKNSQKYALSNGVVDTIYGISRYDLNFFLKAMKFVLIPHPNLWIEFDFHQRSKLINNATIAPGVDKKDVFMPSRIGFYIQTTSPNVADVVIVWMYDSTIAFGSYGFTIDLNAKQLSDEYLTDLYHRQKHQFPQYSQDRAVQLLALEHYFKSQTIHRYAKPAWDLAIKNQDLEMLNKLHNCGIHDTKGEWLFLISAFIFLSSANSFKTVVWPTTKKTKEYTEIQLLEKHQNGQSFVRPHYKIRKTGIFAWRAHFRSTAPAITTKVT